MSKGKYWSISTLKRRGWTDALRQELLPKPRYFHRGGRAVPMWDRDDVCRGEEDPRFRAARQGKNERSGEKQAKPAETRPPQAWKGARTFLDDAWNGTSRPEGPASTLAGLYHAAVLGRTAGLSSSKQVKTGQAESYVRAFLALGRKAPGEPLSGILRRFTKAMPLLWRIGEATREELENQYGSVLLAVAERSVSDFTAAQPEADVGALLAMPDFPVQELLDHPLGYIWSVFYVPQAIRTSLELLVALNPKDEYPEARAMSRHFVLHIGGTNTGKTYAGFQRLMKAPTGVYLAPLRLLALEAQELLLDGGVACSLTTGEEEDREEWDTHVAATAEKLDIHQRYDVAVVDECQMISDRERGYAWTRAILGVLAPEVHLCAAPEAKNLLIRLIESCGDSYEVILHRRKTPLLCMNKPVDYTMVQPGDALIAFSKVGVLSVAEDLRRQGKEPAIIYGALPYSTRRKQMEGFLAGKMRYVAATDAIGMGLNLPIRRIIFMETEKFDGVERRQLKPAEIQQIAGRAGRFGMYDKGYVGATENLEVIQQGMQTVVPPLQEAVVGFSDLMLEVNFDLLEVLTVWNGIPTVRPYVKLDVSRYISLISALRGQGFRLTKEQELRAANIPFDETEEALLKLFYQFLRHFLQGETIERPGLPEDKKTAFTLPELELYCRKLDLYFSFAKAFGMDIDRDALYDEREKTADWINQILLHNLKNNIRFCSRCGASLPLHHSGRLCSACYRKRAYTRRR
ncbi:MAG: hypothetical protein IKD96_06580 [Oscillospiraceae bacterium]|nr:hypothetical protein [Oscillospiraceae bacterium]